MCPSFLATRDEKHSTRGRARLLFEMLEGEVIRDGWRSEEVREALDLCLACKGCRAECPAGVDMATYKAEFLHHHFAGRPAPALGLRHGADPLVGAAGLAGSRAGERDDAGPAFRDLEEARRHPSRPRPPRLRAPRRSATGSSRTGAASPPSSSGRTPSPTSSSRRSRGAAVEVLEAAGHRVAIPAEVLCCGRPLYDFGMLDLARRQLRQILAALRPEIAAGLPDGRPGAELRRGLPRRAGQPLPGGRGRPAALGADLHARRIPRPRRASSRRGCAAGRSSTATATTTR